MTKQLKMIIFRLLIIMENIHVQCYLVDIIGYDTISKPITVNCFFFVDLHTIYPCFLLKSRMIRMKPQSKQYKIKMKKKNK